METLTVFRFVQANMLPLRITLALLLVTLACHVRADDWMEEPYGDSSFNTRALFNTNVTLICNETNVPDDYAFRYWIAPDLTIMPQNYSDSFRTLDGMAGWEVNDDGMELTAFLIQEAHFGFYYCVKQDFNGDVRVIKKAINYKGPYWGDLWEKYETQTIVGLSASGGFLAFVILIGITWYFRYQGDVTDEDESKYHRSSDYQEIPGHTNAAFEPVPGATGFSPVSPVDVHRVTGVAIGTTSKVAPVAF